MKGSSTPLTASYDVALLDLDGVVYIGEQPVPAAPDALSAARAAGMRLAFVTNNASRTPDQVVQLLKKVGVPAAPQEIVTSSHAAAHYLADRLDPSAAVLVLGTTGLIEAIAERGLTPVFSAADAPVAVVQGYSPTLGWAELAEGCVAIRGGAMWIATNLDPTVPSQRGPLPGNGSLVAALRRATDVTPHSTGKPDPTMHAESVQRSGAKRPIVVGDRLDTDIEGASRVGCDSLLVMSGVTTAADLLAAATQHRPDFVGADVAALLSTHPTVDQDKDRYTCGTAVVDAATGQLRLSGVQKSDGDGLNGLRVLMVASWSVLDAGHPVPAIDAIDDNSAALVKQLEL